jgi:hypothetical protein
MLLSDVAYLKDARLEQDCEAEGEELGCFQPTPIRLVPIKHLSQAACWRERGSGKRKLRLHGCNLQPRGKPMACRICIQLQEVAAGAQKPDTPNLLLGLNEAGLRNRARQKEERQLKTKFDLEKHQRACREMADRPAF